MHYKHDTTWNAFFAHVNRMQELHWLRSYPNCISNDQHPIKSPNLCKNCRNSRIWSRLLIMPILTAPQKRNTVKWIFWCLEIFALDKCPDNWGSPGSSNADRVTLGQCTKFTPTYSTREMLHLKHAQRLTNSFASTTCNPTNSISELCDELENVSIQKCFQSPSLTCEWSKRLVERKATQLWQLQLL